MNPTKTLASVLFFNQRGNLCGKNMENMEKSIQQKCLLIGTSVILVWLLLTLSGFAQTRPDAGQITGVVKDPAQALVPGSQVTLTNQQTTVTSTVFTDDQGVYRFLSVSPGTYVVRAEAKGFQATVSPPLKVDSGQTVKDASLNRTPHLVEKYNSDIRSNF